MGTDRDEYLDFYSCAEPFTDVYPDYDLSALPTWVAENISNARVYGNQKKGIILADGRKYHLDNKLNDLTGKEWTFFINSVFTTKYPTNGSESFAHSIRKIHPTPKPPQLMRDLIRFFTKKGEVVFDYFMGVGGSLIGAALAGREAFGIDLSQQYIDAYNAASEELGLPKQPTVCGDALQVLRDGLKMQELLQSKKISLVLLDPPYSNMMSKVKTGADIEVYGKEATPFTTCQSDLGNMPRELFLCSLRESVELILPYVKLHGYIIIFIKDLQPTKKETNLLHSEVVQEINKIPNVFYKGMKIWADETTKLYPYGYPFSFVANQIHQYILVFRKEK